MRLWIPGIEIVRKKFDLTTISWPPSAGRSPRTGPTKLGGSFVYPERYLYETLHLYKLPSARRDLPNELSPFHHISYATDRKSAL